MGCCCGKKCQERFEPCCRRIGCSCKERDSEYRADIEKNRSCTDMLVWGLFLGFLLYMVSAIWTPAYMNGNPDRLIRGTDWDGNICGDTTNDKTKDLPYAYWPDPLNSFRFKVCTDNCNTATMNLYTYSLLPYPSAVYLDKYCLPDSDGETNTNITDASDTIMSAFNGDTEKLNRQIGDINTALPIIGASIAIAFIMSFIFIALMKCCVGLLVWSTIILIGILLFYLGWTFYGKSLELEAAGAVEDEIKQSQYIAYAAWGVTAIYALIILFARQRIKIAIEVIKSASRALKDMKLIVLFPIWPLLFVVGFFMAWLYGSVYIYSNGTEGTTTTPEKLVGVTLSYGSTIGNEFKVLDYDSTTRGAFAPHFFLLLWVNQICIYLTFLVVSGAIADWYFTKRDENGNKIRGKNEGELTPSPVLSSCCRAIRYHMGTLFFAAGLIAIVQFIRYAIRYMERMANGGQKKNRLQKLLTKLVDCLLWCLECCLDKISRNALIFVAIYGDPFCPAVCGSFKLVWSNLARVAVITFFSTIVTGLGKVLIPLATAGVCGAILVYIDPYKTEMNSVFYPVLIILLISMAVGLLFLTVYDTAIDTVFMCFLIDEKANKDRGLMLADPGLRNIVQKYEAQSKELADSMGRGGDQTGASKVGTTEHDVNPSI